MGSLTVCCLVAQPAGSKSWALQGSTSDTTLLSTKGVGYCSQHGPGNG